MSSLQLLYSVSVALLYSVSVALRRCGARQARQARVEEEASSPRLRPMVEFLCCIAAGLLFGYFLVVALFG